MELFDNLAEVGLTTGVLQIIIVAAIAIFLVGMYWRFIVTGIGIVFCVVVFDRVDNLVVNGSTLRLITPPIFSSVFN